MPNEWEFLKSFLEKNVEQEGSFRALWSSSYGAGKSHFVSHLLSSGLGQQMVELLPTLSLLCIFRISEIAEREQRAVAEFNSADYTPEFPDEGRWDLLSSLPPEQLKAYIVGQVYPRLPQAGWDSPLRFLPEWLPAEELQPSALAICVQLLSSSEFPFESYLSFEQSASSLPLEEQLSWFLASPRFGMFSTPERVADLMLDIAAPKPGESIYDPCLGVGSLMVRAVKRNLLPQAVRGNQSSIERVRRGTIYGLEKNKRSCLIALARLMLAGVTRPFVRDGDATGRWGSGPQAGFPRGHDCILCDPPFGEIVDPKAAERFSIRSRSNVVLILQHILNNLNPGGRAVVLVPESVLFRSGPEAQLRKMMLSEYRLEAVISLPERALVPNANTKSSILVVHRLEPLKDVIFISSDVTEPIFKKEASIEEVGKTSSEIQEILGRKTTWGDGGKFLVRAGEIQDDGGTPVYAQRFAWREPVSALEYRGWELVARDRGEDAMQVFLDGIKAAFPQTQVRTLGEVAEVFKGAMVRSGAAVEEKLLPEAERKNAIREVRVTDMLKNNAGDEAVMGIMATRRCLRPEFVQSLPPKQLLQKNDILLSTDFTVGKVARAGDYCERMVASDKIAVIRSEHPQLLAILPMLLTTEPYQSWMQGQAKGSTILHLGIRELRQLPIPVFRQAEALNLLENMRAGQSAETILQLLKARRGYSVWVNFLLDTPFLKDFAGLSTEAAGDNAGRDLLKLVYEMALKPQREKLRQAEPEPLLEWLAGFERLSEALVEIESLPPGTERFTSLQSWRLGFREREARFFAAYRSIRAEATKQTDDDPASGLTTRTVCARIEKLYDNLIRVWEADLEAHLENVRLTANIENPILQVGKPRDLVIAVTNEGLLPLRRLELRTAPFESSTTCPLLVAKGTHQWAAKVTPDETGKQTVRVFWKGVRLDNAPVSGELELAFEVQSLRAAVGSGETLGENPYIYGRVLEGDFDRMFYGREKDMEKVESQLSRAGPTTVILLEGNRRIGKTSLLKHFVRHRLPAGWLSVFINFQDFDGHHPQAGERTLPGIPTRNIFLGMARELVTAARDALPSLELPDLGTVPPRNSLMFRKFLDSKLPTWFNDDQPFTRFRGLLEIIREAVRPKRLLLILDEFDRIQEGIASGITSDQVPENIRHVFQTYGDIGGIFTGSRTIRRLRQEYWNVLFGLGESHQLRGLEEKSALELVERPVAGRLVYSPAASRRIVELCARQPLLIQSICGRLFEVCKESSERTVTVEMVDKVAEEKAGDNEHFETLWGYIRSNRQRCLAFIVDELAEEQRVTLAFSAILDAAERHGVRFRGAGDLERDLEDLLDLEVLGARGERRRQIYRIEVPLFSMWLKLTKDFEQYRRAAMEEI